VLFLKSQCITGGSFIAGLALPPVGPALRPLPESAVSGLLRRANATLQMRSIKDKAKDIRFVRVSFALFKWHFPIV
jgi:hypothetical protein